MHRIATKPGIRTQVGASSDFEATPPTAVCFIAALARLIIPAGQISITYSICVSTYREPVTTNLSPGSDFRFGGGSGGLDPTSASSYSCLFFRSGYGRVANVGSVCCLTSGWVRM